MRSLHGLLLFLSLLLIGALAFDCGCQYDPSCPPCSDGRCCSHFGWCGCMPVYCDVYCQSNCNGGVCGADEADSIILNTTITVAKAKDLGSVIMAAQFESMSKHGSGNKFHSGFYTYQAFITAARSFIGFANNSPIEIRKREVAAFLAQVSHETTSGGSPNAPDEAFKISWNFSYGQAGKAIGVDLINNLDLVAKDPVISLKTALWFWMTPQSPKPSPHDVIIRKWNPSPADRAANRLLGFGVITNIINGGLECGKDANRRAQERIGLYTRYCTILGIHPGDNLDCANQNPFET